MLLLADEKGAAAHESRKERRSDRVLTGRGPGESERGKVEELQFLFAIKTLKEQPRNNHALTLASSTLYAGIESRLPLLNLPSVVVVVVVAELD